MKKIIILLFILLIHYNTAIAYVVGGSNLNFMEYPKPDCHLYSYEPTQYDIDAYKDCIREYIENANFDIQRIEQAKSKAINEARRKLDNPSF